MSCVIVTEIPANEVGNGRLVAFWGCGRTVLRPVTNSVVIWPGARLRGFTTLRPNPSVYPDPIIVIPCPKTGARLMANRHVDMRSIWSIDRFPPWYTDWTGRDRFLAMP